ncbi:shikimate kinase [Liquorilactobacillus sicerae]|uniref:shikimate kinase n=1 Tax=Liquorilactobacillus sicerae TaxID=1416943 RepID=UPI0024806026|nr:shikimate kinase [Liquorilactobacillus sicerae]
MKAILVGFMGTGKTTIGKLLAQNLQVPHFDLDQVIVEHTGLTINQLFERFGEKTFRNLEHQLLLNHLNKDGILSTGGGTPVMSDNLTSLKQSQVPVVLLEASIETIFKRVSNNQARPLVNQLSFQQLAALKQQRNSRYYACADLVVATDDLSPVQISTKINFFLKQLKN